MAYGDLISRILVAIASACVIGLEREMGRSAVAGVRTHVLVSVGAFVFTVVGAYGFHDIVRPALNDPARVAAQVASGIGFIGAGAILRDGMSVRGLTTAASLWISAALGVAAGAGALAVCITATTAAGLVLMLRRVEPYISSHLRWSTEFLSIEYSTGHGTLGPLIRMIEESGLRINGIGLDDERIEERQVPRRSEDVLRIVRFSLRRSQVARVETLLPEILSRSEIRRVEIGGRTWANT